MDYRYVGKGAYEGAYLPGVPARDLADDELAELAGRRGQSVKELSAELEACGLYAARESSKAARSAKPASKAPAQAAKPEPKAEPEASTEPPASVLPIQTGPRGEMVEPAPLPPKAP